MAVMLEPRDEDRIDALVTQVAALAVRMDERFEQVDKGFEQVDKRFERVENELGEQRRDTKAGFEKVAEQMRADLRLTLFWTTGMILSLIAAVITAHYI